MSQISKVSATVTQTQSFALTRRGAGAIDEWIEAVGRHWGYDERSIFAARLCVAELAGNTLEHGVATTGDDRMTVTLNRHNDSIGIELIDSRAPFDPSSVAPTAAPGSIEDAAIGGRGLKLVRAYAESLAYRHDGTHNRVMLTIKAQEPAPA